MTLRKPEARKVRCTLNLLEGSRLKMTENVGITLLDNNSAIDDGCILFMGKEDNRNDDENS